MSLNKYKLGELIQESFRKNTSLEFDISYVRGISNQKEITETKADVDDSVIHKFYIVEPGEFVYNPRTTRMGEKVGLGFNNTNSSLLFSFNNIAFFIKEEAKNKLLPEYLYMYFNRSEFDRYAMINGWGSATELFTFDEMCDIEIELPDLPTQKKYVNIYLSMLENQKSYEQGLEDLKLVCDGYVEKLKEMYGTTCIGSYIVNYSEKNTNKEIEDVVGLSTLKEFREAQSRVNRDELGGYKIVHNLDIAYVPTTDTWKVLAFAVNHFERDVVVSPIYEVFTVDKSVINPDYLAIWMKRSEFDRYARYNSWGSARQNFSFEEMSQVKIPIPSMKLQNSIVDIYNCYIKRKEINEKLKQQIKDICPILIKGAIEEAKEA